MSMQRGSGGYDQPLITNNGGRQLHSAFAFLEGNTTGATFNMKPRERPFLLQTTSYCFIYWGALSIILSPIAGLLMMIIAFRERTVKAFSANPSAWLIIFFIGLTHLGTMAAPFTFFSSPNARQEMANLAELSEYYGAFVFPFVLGAYLIFTFFLFTYYRNQYEDENFSNKDRLPIDAQKRVDLNNARTIKLEIEQSTQQRIEYILPLAFAIGVCETVLTRVCYFSNSFNEGCDRWIAFEVPSYAESDFYTISTINFFLLFVCFNTCIFFALSIYYQTLLQVKEFRYIGNRASGRQNEADTSPQTQKGKMGALFSRGGGNNGGTTSKGNGGGGNANKTNNFNEREAKRVDNLANPENISTWTITWRQIVVDMKRKPEIRAATNSTFPMMVTIIIMSVVYISIYNLFAKERIAAFTAGFVCLIVVCMMVVIGFLHVTVQLADSVDFQTKVIAKLQNDMQVRLDEEGPDMDLFHRQLLTAKVRVLQSLDVYLRHSSSKPKLIGLSMESFRWTIIIVGLLMMNVFFFSLYYSHCATNS